MAKDLFSAPLITFQEATGKEVGLLIDGRVHRLSKLAADAGVWQSDISVETILKDWQLWQGRLPKLVRVARSEDGVSIDKVLLAAPFIPNAIFCSGANYHSHVAEMNKRLGVQTKAATDGSPYFFLKSPAHTIVASAETVEAPSGSVMLDWEIELAVVIGRGGRAISESEAMAHVAGYAILIDLSARDCFTRADLPAWKDWLSAKSFEGAAPFGPAFTPAELVEDPSNLALKLWVNGELKQDGNTSEMIYGISEQIAYLSRRVALRPGDVIATGSPAGVGFASGVYLKPGDKVAAEITGLGRLEAQIGGSA
jgi:2-keto-4-pentenoate hydratase/2-oxohepta-3-ene-1,7-dioic acid hydratase in catechol pathway